MFKLNSEWTNPLRVFLFWGHILTLSAVVLWNSSCKREDSNGTNPTYQDIELETPDGALMECRLYFPLTAGGKPPGLILLPMEGSGADSWHSFADLAISRGYMSIAITPLGGPENAIQEVLTAKEHLLEQGAHPSNLFVIGAGLGANIGVTYSQGDSDIQGIILVSPGLTLQGISIESIVEGLTERPMLFMAAEGDSYSHSSVLKLKRAAPVYSELKTYLGSARGTDLLDTHPTAVFGILEWIDPILKK